MTTRQRSQRCSQNYLSSAARCMSSSSSTQHVSLSWKNPWQKLDVLDLKLQGFSSLAEELHYIKGRIYRHLNFGESLEDLS